MLIITPALQQTQLFGKAHSPFLGVKGTVIRPDARSENAVNALDRRADSATEWCKKWSHQSAIVNGTMYIYGGRMSTSSAQTNDTWNNEFVTLDLTKSWDISSPAFRALPQPSGPPPVSNGYLWSSYGALYLYGGEFSDTPPEQPVDFAVWEYDIKASEWKEHSNPRTSAGINAAGGGEPVQRSAEGAGINVPSLGRGFYFGGHLDLYTTPGWSAQIPRVYLKSLIEYTFPGHENKAVSGLDAAGSDGAWRNITEGGLQESAGFTERADGVLVFVPGFGDEGILLGLAGGTETTFTQMNVIDVYDIAGSTWYKQSTSGKSPKIRVNPCAVVAAAADGTSYNVYMFGGQNLQPFQQQTQYDDMWILSIPSFTWIEVDQSKQSVPFGRAGHSCNIWDGQMVLVGGYVGQEISCDSPGVYVFNTSTLEWVNRFTSLTGPSQGAGKTIDVGDPVTGNPFSQQGSQLGSNSSSGLHGSFGYSVPQPVIDAIGGNPLGGATVTAPAQSATGGPIATGKPIYYTVTSINGQTVTTTASPGNSDGSSAGRVGAIVAGTIAGFLLFLAGYLAFCAYIYRKRVQLYQRHLAMAQRGAADPQQAEKESIFGRLSSAGNFFAAPKHVSEASSGQTPWRPGHSSQGSYTGSADGLQGNHPLLRPGSSGSDSEDLIAGQEPSFWGPRGVVLNPRRTLRVINQ
ncbi:hypothetical protein P152DRAFT_404107 [Eremomyces bilateralis CBS 781.70]|uniref:Kelch repeat protein n=1 Tax=Eremomyces bilateralis CBS 781.70 TaxID=1392243 RepID=A0A6G1FTM8_9PEZI|nr:uncharacterized protein P152DRAFT_404107 [Eremomyces bilateralis CBS 781.70]KAF1809029.1 hypothetical protein P152DRAFT_404107 [Eremomyces bilateralis CBS 781.70]